MGTRPLIRIEENSSARVVSFYVEGAEPEKRAFGLLRDWAVQKRFKSSTAHCSRIIGGQE